MTNETENQRSQGELSRLVGGSAFIFSIRIVGAAATFVAQLLLARWMGASELGVYVLAFSWCILLATLSTCGFRLAAMRFVGEGLSSKGAGYVRGFVTRSRQFVLVVSSVVAALGCLAIVALRPESVASSQGVFIVALLAVPVFALLNVYAGYAHAMSRFTLGFLPTNVLRPLLFLAGIASFWFLGGALDADTAIRLQFLALLAVAIVTAFVGERRVRIVTANASPIFETRLWIRTSLPLLVAALYTGYFPEMMVIMVGAFVPSDTLAVFHVCFRVAMLISFGLYAVDSIAAPRITELLTSGDREALQQFVNRTTRLKFWGAVAGLLVLIPAGRWMLGLFGDEFVSGYPVLLVLVGAQLVQAAGGTVIRLLSMSGHQDRCLLVFAVATVLAFVLVAALVPAFGLIGAAVAVLINTMISVIWMRALVIRYLSIRPTIV
ncbi:MAG: lipopolysaccharide biosynthesis protein [Gammaproteobacteria bacterium]